ncbi:hypothetical protein DY245_06570 [Streptomyces inhibens]|uniref:CAAX prenyl protease 2/Lysostaphin resistance protein A-like domain-containing protein n=1 Tax=Streptomyces inhibens TaxID=2293571 RepID=A0A371Q8R4_STRIH|nr:hypothetical protein DY245_06570 [Streptomyces inhibens]
MAAMFGALTLAVMRRCGVSRAQLGIWPPSASTARGRAQAVAVGATAAFAALITITIVNAVPTFLPGEGSAYGGSQADYLGWKTFWLQAANVVVSGVIEDVVMVGAIAALLTMARRPAWEMYALSIVLEVGMHLYFGVPAIGLVVVAAVRLALYRATGRLTPLVIGHIAYGLFNGLLETGWALGAILAATALVAVITAGVCTPARQTEPDGKVRGRSA